MGIKHQTISVFMHWCSNHGWNSQWMICVISQGDGRRTSGLHSVSKAGFEWLKLDVSLWQEIVEGCLQTGSWQSRSVVHVMLVLQMEGSVYWPVEKGVEMVMGRVKLTLQSTNTCKHWVERIIYITDSRLSKVVVHLQFTEWPGR